MKGLKSILFAAAAMLAVPTLITSCEDWTEIEAKDYFSATANTEAYKAQLKNYFNSPHKVMFGWFGSWSAGNISNKLIGLPTQLTSFHFGSATVTSMKLNKLT